MTKTKKAQQARAVAVIIADSDIDNDYYFIDMADDNSRTDLSIPAAFLMGKNGHLIKQTLLALGRREAYINIPVNITHKRLHELNQPPWLVW